MSMARVPRYNRYSTTHSGAHTQDKGVSPTRTHTDSLTAQCQWGRARAEQGASGPSKCPVVVALAACTQHGELDERAAFAVIYTK